MERLASPDPLPCPRCSSSNTKFCYYNNYNLSQPRHFCKACKRYWTRGGILRNVPVGGGCRKNKKFKRGCGGHGDAFPSATTALINPSHLQPDIDISNRPINNPFVYSFPTELNFPFSATRVSSNSPRFDDLPRISGPRLGFSPDYRNHMSAKDIQDRDANCITFGSSSFAPSSSTMASLLAQHQRFAASDEFSSLMPYEDMQMVVGNGELIGRESKILFEGELIRSNQIDEQMMNSHDNPSPFLWNSNVNNVNVGVWFDPSSSVPPLI